MILFYLGLVSLPAFGESFLTAQEFPKTFEDLSFKARMDFYVDSYEPYNPQYDENGVCISGCAYPGVTLKEDMIAIEEANNKMADLVNSAVNAQNNQTTGTEPGTSGVPSPTTATQTTTGGQQTTTYNQPSYNVMPVGAATDWCHNGLPTDLPLRYPIDMTNFKYVVTGDFGLRPSGPNGGGYLHGGLDFGTPKGTPVYATADGVVETVARQDKPGGGGLYIMIRHNHDLLTQYIHLDKALVKQGDKVHACQEIAKSGNSGKTVSGGSYADHLDYRIRFASNKSNFVDILCPCKSANSGSKKSSGNDLGMACDHSLFHAQYKFMKYNPNNDVNKRSVWRAKNGHCMIHNTDLLPDEVR